MGKRALLLAAAVITVAGVLALTVSPISPQAAAMKRSSGTSAPRSGKKALTILRANVMQLASDYSHKRNRAVCSDLTKRELKHLGGMSDCKLTIAVLHLFLPVKKLK